MKDCEACGGTGKVQEKEQEYWTPELGDVVYMNNPEPVEPLGKVVGFVDDPSKPRHGQPILEQLEDKEGLFSRKKGDKFVIHPQFLLPEPWAVVQEKARRGEVILR